MEYLAHRGMWFKQEERNTLAALFEGLDAGFGLEVDVRDMSGELVISHDVPQPSNPPPVLTELFSYYSKHQFTSTLALNIKADGLHNLLLAQLNEFEINNYFVFDMAVPDAMAYSARGMKLFMRSSDLEIYRGKPPISGIWLDELIHNWVDSQTILKELAGADALCVVSRELHGRDKTEQWNDLKLVLSTEGVSNRLMLCTDFPQEAKRFFE
jgi:hypothetical protein